LTFKPDTSPDRSNHNSPIRGNSTS
jgi:hypothetical protein